MRGTIPGLASPHPLPRLLPAILQGDDFVLRMLDGLDEVLAPVLVTLDSLEAYFDPMVAPEDFLAWLATWVGVPLDRDLEEHDQRRLLAAAAELHGVRGTVHGLWRLVGLVAPDCSLEVEDGGWVDWSLTPGDPLPDAEGSDSLRVSLSGPDEQVERAMKATREWCPAHIHVEFVLP